MHRVSSANPWKPTSTQRYRPDLSELIEGSLGELSLFHQTFGYRADGVSPDTATLPQGWEERLTPLSNENTGGATGWCLDPHDLAISKLAARREKDLAYVAGLLRFKMVRQSRLQELIDTLEDPGCGKESARHCTLAVSDNSED